MKKKDIWISLAIIAASAAVVYHYTHGKGYVEIDTGGADATLELQSSLFSNATIHSGAKPTQVRAIVHRPQQLQVSMNQDGQRGQINSSGPWANLSKIKVKNNDPTTLRLGPPFVITPSIHKTRNQISIDFSITGRAGEHYQKYALKNNRSRSGAQLTIKDEEGNVLETGKFQYG